ncbi:DUF6888 family protein [Leptolyngbya sp. AN03gr2]|uniref:DUF6888 family protein n=1 Tax=unclassified Leptolyngbya TaxID=2650499 RepID=UPI003D311053
MFPTNAQAITCLIVCQWLSNGYRDIHLFRFNPQSGYVFILAGDEMQILVYPSGTWGFINEA